MLWIEESRKGGSEYWDWQVAILTGVFSEDLTGNVMYELRAETGQGRKHMDIREKRFLGWGKSMSKGPEVRVYLKFMSYHASVVGME